MKEKRSAGCGWVHGMREPVLMLSSPQINVLSRPLAVHSDIESTPFGVKDWCARF